MTKKTKIILDFDQVYYGNLKKGKPHGKGAIYIYGKKKLNPNEILKTTVAQAFFQVAIEDRKTNTTTSEKNLKLNKVLNTKYEGRFKEGKWDGEFKCTYFLQRNKKRHSTIIFNNNKILKEIEKIKYSNGEIYSGELRDEEFHGIGTITRKDGAKYQGSWKKGVMHGKGKRKYIGGDLYEGDFKNNKRHGKGTHNYNNKDQYVGHFKNNKMHGKGTYTWPNGNKYVGEWKNNIYHGKGSFLFHNGEKYVGDYKNGKYHGKGTRIFADHIKYVGQWRQDKRHGKGNLTYLKGERAGEKHIGNWKNDQMHGKGTLFYSNGDKFIGNWKNDKINGKGKLKLKGGITYEGDWKNGEAEGYGSTKFDNGDCYIGEFKKNLRHGKGTYKSKKSTYIGQWIKGSANGEGIETFKDGMVYTGNFKNNLFEGYGILKKKNEYKHEGCFKNGNSFGFVKSTFYKDGYEEECIQQWDENKLLSGLDASGIYSFYIKDKNQLKNIIENKDIWDVRFIQFYESSQPSIFNTNFNKFINRYSGLNLSIVFDKFEPSEKLHKYFSKLIRQTPEFGNGLKSDFADMPNLYFEDIKLITNNNIVQANEFVINLIKNIYLNSDYVVDPDYIEDYHSDGDFTLLINKKEVFKSSVFNKKINKKDLIEIHKIENEKKLFGQLKILLGKYLANLDFKKNFSKFSKNKKTNSIELEIEKFDTQARLDYANYDFSLDKEWKKILDTHKIK